VFKKIDNIGRIVIPKEIRKQLDIKEGEILYISISNNKITLEKAFEFDLALLQEYKQKIDLKIKELEQKKQ